MALSLFDHRAFAMGGTVAFIYGMALFGSTYLVPVFMQEALHLPPSQAGAVLLPAGLVLAVTIPIAGRLADRIAVSRMVSAGLVLLAASFFLMLGVGIATSLALITLWAVIGRLGLGMILPSLNLGSMQGVANSLIAQGSSTINFLRQLGGAVGIGLVGNVLEWRLRTHAAAPLAAFHETFALVGAITACATFAAWRMGPGRRAATIPSDSAPS
jgi:predicted MFS family arabinose efflux permease